MIISIIGRGNVAFHLSKAFANNHELHCVNPHTLEGLPDNSDIVIIAVKDDAIGEVASKLRGRALCIAHTSGSVAMNILEGCAAHTGVIYPLQTFSKEKALNYEEIPFFIEGSDETAENLLSGVALSISGSVRKADSSQRELIHIAAVFACNFVNHLIGIANEILAEGDMDYKLLLPLIKETIDKLNILPPHEAQTGPAARKDMGIVGSHIDKLNYKPDLRQIYSLLSERIMTHKEVEK